MTFEKSIFGLYLTQRAYQGVIEKKNKFCLDKVRVREAIEKTRNSNEILKLGTLTFLEKELGFGEK